MDLSLLVLLGKGIGVFLVLIFALAIIGGIYFAFTRFLLWVDRGKSGKTTNSFGSLAFLILLVSANLGDLYAYEAVTMNVDWTLYVATGLYAGTVLMGMLLAARPYVGRKTLAGMVLMYPIPAILWVTLSPWAGIVHSYMHFEWG